MEDVKLFAFANWTLLIPIVMQVIRKTFPWIVEMYPIYTYILSFRFAMYALIATLFTRIISGFNIQILWGDLGWCCPYDHPKWPKDQLDMQPCSQAQRASRTHFCWKEMQRSARKGSLAPQGTTFKEGQLEEEQHPFSSTLPLIVSILLVTF